jgi:hypothetical protein
LIEQLLEKETGADVADPRSFGNSLEWAGDLRYPLIVAVTEEVVSERREADKTKPRALWIKDKFRLVGLRSLGHCPQVRRGRFLHPNFKAVIPTRSYKRVG